MQSTAKDINGRALPAKSGPMPALPAATGFPRTAVLTEILPKPLITISRDNRRFGGTGFGNRVVTGALIKE
jgi:hypothetical protein